MDFHGVISKENPDGIRPVDTVNTNAVGIVGTAPGADPDKFPYHTPVRVSSRRMLAGIGADGTLPRAMDGVFKQGGAECVLIRVPEPAPNDLSNIIGGIDDTSGDFEGIYALKAARSEIGITPRIIVAPGFSHMKAVADALIDIANTNRGYVYADGGDTNNADAINYRKQFGSDRIRIHDPSVKTTFNGQEILLPVSAMLAGARAVLDDQFGWWWSLSNFELKGVQGTSRPIDYAYNDPNSTTQYLNRERVATMILAEGGGWKCFGNRGCASDPKWEFESIRRANDIIADSLDRSLTRWAPDRPMSIGHVESVLTSINAYIESLIGTAILGGRVWLDKEKNTKTTLSQGSLFIGRDLTVPAPNEHTEIEYLHTEDYYEVLLNRF